MKKIKIILSVILMLVVILSSVTVLGETSVYENSNPFFEIESVNVDKDSEFEVKINIGNNPGFWAAKFSITCDEGLSFVENNSVPDFTSASINNVSYTTNLSNNIFTCLINSDTSSNITYNGTILTLKLKADDTFIGDYNIYFVDYSSSNFINYNAEKVPFTFENGVVSLGEGYVFEVYNCSPNNSGGTLSTYSQTDLTPNGTLSNFKPTAVGDYVTYTLPNIEAGTYNLNAYSRDYSGRGTFDIYVNDVLLKSESFVANMGMYKHEFGIFTISSAQDVTVKFVTNVVGSLYLKTFELVKVSNDVSSSKFNVYIDDVLVNSIEKGNVFNLPNEDDNIVAYKNNNGVYYACGQEVDVESDLYFSSVKLSLSTLSTASMRLNSSEVANNVSGIRFYTEVDEDVVSTLKDNGFEIELGTLIAPKKYFGIKPTTDLKFDVDFGKTVNYATVPYMSDTYFYDGEFSGIVGSIRNIKENHAIWNFVGRGYAKVSYNGIEKIVYATGKDQLPERSICYIAYCLKNDINTYESYLDDQKAIIDYYYKLYVDFRDPHGEDIFD